MSAAYYFLACFGFALAVAKLHAGEPVRRLFCWKADPEKPHMACKLVHCTACIGFWVGFGLSLALGRSVSSLSGIPVADAALDGLCVLAVNMILLVILTKLGLDSL